MLRSLVPMTCKHLCRMFFLSRASYMLKMNWFYATSLHLSPQHHIRMIFMTSIDGYHYPFFPSFTITILIFTCHWWSIFSTLLNVTPSPTMAKFRPGTMSQGRSHCACRLPGWSRKALCPRTRVDVLFVALSDMLPLNPLFNSLGNRVPYGKIWDNTGK